MMLAYMVEKGLNPAQTPLTALFTHLDNLGALYDSLESEGSDDPWWS